MAKERESEADYNGTFLGMETDEDTGQEWYLLHGGDQWRPPWTY